PVVLEPRVLHMVALSIPVTAATLATSNTANARLPVPQPTSSTRSPWARPPNRISKGARRRLQRPICCSYASALVAANVELGMFGEPDAGVTPIVFSFLFPGDAFPSRQGCGPTPGFKIGRASCRERGWVPQRSGTRQQ